MGQSTYTWDAGNNSNVWNNAFNWNPNFVPGSGDHVIIAAAPYDPEVTGTITIGSMEFTSGGHLDFASGAVLEIRGNLTDVYNTGFTNWDADEGAVVFMGWIGSDIEGEFNFFEMHVDKEPSYGLEVNLLTGSVVLINQALLLMRSGELITNYPSAELIMNSVYDAGGPSWRTAYIDFYAAPSNEADITGEVTIRQSFPGNYKTYHYFSSPVCSSGTLYSNAQFASFTDQTDSWDDNWVWTPSPGYVPDYIYYYEPEQDPDPGDVMEYGWQGVNFLTSNEYDMERGQGVCARFKPFYNSSQCVPVAFTGTPNRGSFYSHEMDLTNFSETADGCNLMGNPYCSPIDWNLVYDDNTDLPLIAIWQNDGNQYTGEYWWYDADIPYGDYDWDGTIAIAQAFFVVADHDDQQIDFRTRHCINDHRTTVHRKEKPQNLLSLQIIGEQYRDETILHFKNEYSSDWKEGEDRDRALVNTVSIDILNGNRNTHFDKRPFPDVEQILPLVLNIPDEDTYTLACGTYSLNESLVKVFLEDRKSGIMIPLNELSRYKINGGKGRIENRFFLRILPHGQEPSAVSGQTAQLAFFRDDLLIVQPLIDPSKTFDLKVMDAEGRVLINESSAHSGKSTFNCNTWSPGNYILTIAYNGKTESTKLVKQ